MVLSVRFITYQIIRAELGLASVESDDSAVPCANVNRCILFRGVLVRFVDVSRAVSICLRLGLTM